MTPEWMHQAACRGRTSEMFPDKGAAYKSAVAVCMTCPVRVECGEHALAANETYGVWGGMSERKRQAVQLAREWASLTPAQQAARTALS